MYETSERCRGLFSYSELTESSRPRGFKTHRYCKRLSILRIETRSLGCFLQHLSNTLHRFAVKVLSFPPSGLLGRSSLRILDLTPVASVPSHTKFPVNTLVVLVTVV